MNVPILEVKNLTKIFGSFKAVNDLSFSMEEGELLGFLGPNGAGKTTTIQMLLAVLAPTSGEIRYFGKDLATHREEILEKVNFSTTYINLPWNLTIRENLTFMSYLYDIQNRRQRVKDIIELFKLEKLAGHQMHQLSAGQLTRVNLAKAFLNRPKVLLLDEPTASLDPDIAAYIRTLIMDANKKEKLSIIFTSHNMTEIEEVCDRVIFINKGTIIADDAPERHQR
jgi:ABC-2 type transport system ATP-binding protein